MVSTDGESSKDYFPLVNTGTSRSFAFCVSGDLAVSTLYNACCRDATEFEKDGYGPGMLLSTGHYANLLGQIQCKGFFYISCLSHDSNYAFGLELRTTLPVRHRMHNFYGYEEEKKQQIAKLRYMTLYDDDYADTSDYWNFVPCVLETEYGRGSDELCKKTPNDDFCKEWRKELPQRLLNTIE